MPEPGETAGTYAKGRRRRAEIVRSALETFGVVGYRTASLVQIAAACGVSRAGLLHHFSSKEELLAAVLEERDRVNGELFFAGADPARDGRDYLDRLVRVVEHNAANPGIVSLFAVLSAEAAADPTHPANGYFVRRYRGIRDDIAVALGELARRGEVHDTMTDAAAAAADLVAVIDGLQVQWLLDPDRVDMAARVRNGLSQLVR